MTKQTIRLKGTNYFIPCDSTTTIADAQERYAIIGDDGEEIVPVKRWNNFPIMVYLNSDKYPSWVDNDIRS